MKVQDYLRPGLVFGPNSSAVATLQKAETRGEWMLKAHGRVRWGTSSQIREDIEHFETYGRLPERKVGWL